jgi:hypothetical protein
MLKRDNIIFGLIIGMVLPVLFYGVLFLIGKFVETGTTWAMPFEPDRMMLLALAINVIPIRAYFVNYKFDKTGRGVLLSTFILMVSYFLFIRYF